jgi:glutaredoxin 3
MSVTIYSTPTCHWCHKTKEYFKEKGVEYTDINVGEDVVKAEEMVQKSGQMGVPVIEIDGQIIIGFDLPKINTALHLE